MGRWGIFGRPLAREIGGMPVWAMLLVAFISLGTVGILASASATQGDAPTFVAPSGAVTPSVPQAMPYVVFLGDSYTQGAGGAGVTWPDVLGQEQGWDVANLGLGGTGYLRTSGERGCGRAYCGTFQEASAEIIGAPRMIFISGGRNDLGLATDDIAAAAEELLVDLRNRYPEAKTFLVNPWYDDDAPPARLGAISAALEAAAARHDVVFLDTGQPLRGEEDLISDDGVHPNGDGYRVLAKAVGLALTKALDE